MAQVNLEEIHRVLATSPMPRRGQLSFFVADDPSGETGYLDDCAVVYSQPGAKLVPPNRPRRLHGADQL